MYKESFFIPLKLKNTYYTDTYYPANVINKMAHAYINKHDITQFNAGLSGPAGAMVMNGYDVLVWIKNLFLNRRILNQNSLVQLEQTIKMPTTPPNRAHSKYGLGIYSLKIKKFGTTWWYTGVIDGYTSMFIYIPKMHKIIVVQVARHLQKQFF